MFFFFFWPFFFGFFFTNFAFLNFSPFAGPSKDTPRGQQSLRQRRAPPPPPPPLLLFSFLPLSFFFSSLFSLSLFFFFLLQCIMLFALMMPWLGLSQNAIVRTTITKICHAGKCCFFFVFLVFFVCFNANECTVLGCAFVAAQA